VATVVEVFLSQAYWCEERATKMATLVELVESIATMLLYSGATVVREHFCSHLSLGRFATNAGMTYHVKYGEPYTLLMWVLMVHTLINKGHLVAFEMCSTFGFSIMLY
jgi:hypothetical protein